MSEQKNTEKGMFLEACHETWGTWIGCLLSSKPQLGYVLTGPLTVDRVCLSMPPGPILDKGPFLCLKQTSTEKGMFTKHMYHSPVLLLIVIVPSPEVG